MAEKKPQGPAGDGTKGGLAAPTVGGQVAGERAARDRQDQMGWEPAPPRPGNTSVKGVRGERPRAQKSRIRANPRLAGGKRPSRARNDETAPPAPSGARGAVRPSQGLSEPFAAADAPPLPLAARPGRVALQDAHQPRHDYPSVLRDVVGAFLIVGSASPLTISRSFGAVVHFTLNFSATWTGSMVCGLWARRAGVTTGCHEPKFVTVTPYPAARVFVTTSRTANTASCPCSSETPIWRATASPREVRDRSCAGMYCLLMIFSLGGRGRPSDRPRAFTRSLAAEARLHLDGGLAVPAVHVLAETADDQARTVLARVPVDPREVEGLAVDVAAPVRHVVALVAAGHRAHPVAALAEAVRDLDGLPRHHAARDVATDAERHAVLREVRGADPLQVLAHGPRGQQVVVLLRALPGVGHEHVVDLAEGGLRGLEAELGGHGVLSRSGPAPLLM